LYQYHYHPWKYLPLPFVSSIQQLNWFNIINQAIHVPLSKAPRPFVCEKKKN